MPFTTLGLLDAQVAKRPDQPAIVTPAGRGYRYAELAQAAESTARALLAHGLGRGDRVGLAFHGDEAPEYLAAYFGIQRAGGVVLPLNPRAPRSELAGVLANSGAAQVICGRGAATGERDLSWPLTHRPSDSVLPIIGEDDPAELLYTSGTTGLQKGVLVSHRSAVGLVSPVYEAMLGGRSFLDPLPLHTYAGNAYLLFCVKAGLTNVYLEKFEPARYMELLRRPEVAATYAVSSMWLRIFKELPQVAAGYEHIISVSFGAAHMPDWGVRKLSELFPRSFIYNIYGLTEAGGAVCAFPPGEHLRRAGSVGKPVGDSQVRIVDEQGRICAVGQNGEVQLRLGGVPTRSYFNDPQATHEVFGLDGWVRSGDIGYLDAEGYLYLVDRAKDIIIQGGNNISGAEVEAALLAHEDVAEAAAFGLPHETLGETVCAVVVPRKGAPAPQPEALRSFLRDRLAAYKLPARIDLADELPRNDMGKVLKRELRLERMA